MITAIVTDIEGTTTSLSFVKDVLFPYAHTHLAEYVNLHKNETSVRQLLDEANRIIGGGQSDEQIVKQMLVWIDEDKKVTPLKSLQGLIWEHGYKSKAYTGHMYADAIEYLNKWHANGIKLYVYSSGSVYAQKLLFAHTDAGDLTPLFTDYFDTHIGQKRETQSYQNITQALDLPANEILFLSDIKEELDAARQAGMQTCWLVRDSEFTPGSEHPQVFSFKDIVVS